MAPQTKSFWGEIGKGVLIACTVSIIAVPTTIAVMGAKIDQNTVDIGVQRGELTKVSEGRLKDSERIVELVQKIEAQQREMAEIKQSVKQVGADVVLLKEMGAETRTDFRWIKDMMKAQARGNNP